MTPHEKEALRQQMLLRALLGDARPGVVAGWLRHGDSTRTQRGLAAYRAHAGASAERALAAAFPTLQQLLGAASFAALARDCWRRQPPQAGDLALWGEDLPAFIADAAALADEPYLADVARLEWALHRAASAGPGPALVMDAEARSASAFTIPPLRLAPGTAVLVSSHPIVAIWQAHQSPAAPASAPAPASASAAAAAAGGGLPEDRYADVRLAFAQGRAETALVQRHGWRPAVLAVAADAAAFVLCLLARQPLAQALAAAGPDFDFGAWLAQALRQGVVAAERDSPHPTTAESP